jgi:excisionase family DNA binding protein
MSEHASLVPTAQSGPAYLTPDQVAELLVLSTKSVYRLAKADPTMPMLKLGGTVRFPRERLLRWLQDREQGRPRIRRQMLAAAKVVAKPAPDKEATRA